MHRPNSIEISEWTSSCTLVIGLLSSKANLVLPSVLSFAYWSGKVTTSEWYISGVSMPRTATQMEAFDIPAFPVDTHIHRLMYRWNLSSGKNVVQTEKDAKRLFPMKLWNKLHLQIIYYAREYSPARGWNIDKDIITKTIGRKSVLRTIHGA